MRQPVTHAANERQLPAAVDLWLAMSRLMRSNESPASRSLTVHVGFPLALQMHVLDGSRPWPISLEFEWTY